MIFRFVAASIEYDPNRSARIALLHYVDGENDIFGPGWFESRQEVMSGRRAEIRPGNASPYALSLGNLIHNIELKEGHGAQLARSAGADSPTSAKEASLDISGFPRERFAWSRRLQGNHRTGKQY